MRDDDEIICLDDDEDMPLVTGAKKPKSTRRESLRNTGSVIKYNETNGSFEEPVLLSDSDDEPITARGRKKVELISDDEELPDLDDDFPGHSSTISKRKKQQTTKKPREKSKATKPSAKIKLPKLLSISTKRRLSPPATSSTTGLHNDLSTESPSKKSPKKKKTLADIVTDIHETSTDEIDSDEISASQERLNVDPSPTQIAKTMYGKQKPDEPQPCCSKSLQPQPVSKTAVTSRRKHELISSDEEEELPDIDFDIEIPSSSKMNYPINNDINYRSTSPKNHEFNRPVSTESTSTTAGYSSVSNSQTSLAGRETKKKQKEAEAERKKQEREVKRLEREQKKAEEAKEKELKKVENELRRNAKPGEAFKYMTVAVDSAIISRLDSLIPQLVAAEIRYESKTCPIIENSITFQRELVHQAMDDNLQIQRVSTIQEEDQLMIVIDSDQIIPMVNAQLHRDTEGNEDLGVDLISWVESIKAISSGKKITLFLYNMEKFFKKIKQKTQQEFRSRVLNANDGQPPKKTRKNNNKTLPQITRTELQSALIELQLQTGVNYRMVKDVAELGTALIQYTKAIADAPFKKQRQESQGFDWFAMSDSAGSVRVEQDGNGLRKLWIDQLQQFNNVGMDVAVAISNKYPSPRALIEAYQRCTSEEEGQGLVRDVSVTTGDGPLARKRKVGPELSKKIYRFFTSTSGDRFLGSTSDMR